MHANSRGQSHTNSLYCVYSYIHAGHVFSVVIPLSATPLISSNLLHKLSGQARLLLANLLVGLFHPLPEAPTHSPIAQNDQPLRASIA